MTCVDWRTCAHQEVAPLLAAETQAWCRDLDWDVTEAWRVVEPARRAGQLPGFIVRDDCGRPIGWTAFLLHRTSLQVLAFAAPDAMASETLVDAILASPEAWQAESIIFCVRAAASSLWSRIVRSASSEWIRCWFLPTAASKHSAPRT